MYGYVPDRVDRVTCGVAGELSHYPGVGMNRTGRVVPQPEIFLHALA
jgi:hypothetical protein